MRQRGAQVSQGVDESKSSFSSLDV
jgi:hypothetical protein